jgi:hypothetical protein
LKEDRESIGRPKVDVKELLDEEGKTKMQPFNFMTDHLRPDRLKDKREGQKRQSLDTSSKNKFSKFNTRKIMSPVIKERNSHLSQKVQQAKEGQDAYKGPDLIYEEKVYQRQFQSFGKVSGQRTNS